MAIQDRLKTFRANVSTTCEAYCEELTKRGYKITVPTIYGYESGQRQPSVSYISGLVDVYDANPMWLLQGQGEMFMNEDDKFKSSMPKNLDLTNIKFIPVVDLDLSAGYGSIKEEIEATKDFISFGKGWLRKNITANINDIVIFSVRGDSMDGGSSRIKNGSLVMVDTSTKGYLNDGIYAIRLNDAFFIKRLQYLPNKILVKSDNPIYEPFEIDLKSDNFSIIGNVVYVLNNVSCV